jgi:hypothetical protein
MRAAMSASQTRSSMAKLFELSPGGTVTELVPIPAAARAASVAARWWRATISSLTIAALAPGRSAAIFSPSDPSRPRPMMMS